MRTIPPGATSVSCIAEIYDDAAAPALGLVASTFPTVNLMFEEPGATPSTITLSDLALLTSPWASGGVKEINGGRYRLDIPNQSALSGSFKIWGEASGKHLIVEPIEIGFGNLGNGPRTVTITVNDGANPLQGAQVALSLNSSTKRFGITNVSGQVVFHLIDGTWTVGIYLAGYSFGGASLVVDGDEASTYSMVQIVPTPSTPGQTTAYLHVYDKDGNPRSGVTVTMKASQVNDIVGGAAYEGVEHAAISDVNGYIEWTNRFKGVGYILKGGTSGRIYVISIPTTAGPTYELPSIIYV